jgi:hypothetical protein
VELAMKIYQEHVDIVVDSDDVDDDNEEGVMGN